jgi:hypothetical protein
VLGHSAAGLLAVEAAGRLRTDLAPTLVVHVISVGAPLAGMGRNPWGGEDMRHTPLAIALGSRFTHWPEPASGVTLEIYPTTGDDPVMQRVLGHDPGDARVLPRRAMVRALPPAVGHNDALTWICERLLSTVLARREEHAARPSL